MTGGGSAFYTAATALSVAFPPAALATLITGVLLSLGTKWGLLRHLWVVAKIVLSLGVVVTGIAFTDRLALQSEQVVRDNAIFGAASAPILFIVLALTHVLMLGVASVLSTYKPKGKTRFGQIATNLYANSLVERGP